jgi:hypothetical protein
VVSAAADVDKAAVSGRYARSQAASTS